MSIDLSGRSILIVEDEPLIAMEVAENLRSAHANVLIAATLHEGMRLAECAPLSAAILDLILGRDDVAALCKRLTARGIPFVIYSGYGDVPNGCEPGVIVEKPAESKVLLRALAQVLAKA